MKKVFLWLSVVLAAVLCMSMISFADEAPADKKSIEFRNLPWGTTVGDFVKNTGGIMSEGADYSWWQGPTTIPDDGFDCYAPTIYSVAYYLDCPYDVNNISYDDYAQVPARDLSWYIFFNNEPVSVAGYEIDRIDLYFMQPVKGGKVDHTKENAKFYMGRYNIPDNLDRISVFDDLTTKLNSIYGDFFYEVFDGQVIRMWKDDANNIVALVRHDTEWEVLDDIEIVYMAGTAMDDLQELNAAMYEEQTAADSNAREENAENYDGL